MRIALITVTRNDDFRFEEWCSYYKDDIYLHIIVDDASEPEYVDRIKSYFTSSVVIERKVNGGSNAAVNDGLKYALKDPEVDAIMVLDNDIKCSTGFFPTLHSFLFSDDKLGMVGPIVLRKDSNIIEDYGVTIRLLTTSMNEQGGSLEDIPEGDERYVDAIAGGITMAKRSFYETVGLQDETIFMYCDERDMCYRARKFGYKMGVTKNAVSWHQHILGKSAGKKLRSDFLIARNRVYLQKKYLGKGKAYLSAMYAVLALTKKLIFNASDSSFKLLYRERIEGIKNGITNNMSNDEVWM